VGVGVLISKNIGEVKERFGSVEDMVVLCIG